MRAILLKFILIVIGSIIMLGCASRKEVVQFKEDVQSIKYHLDSLRSDNQKLKRMLRELDNSIAQLEEDANRTRADLLAEMADIRQQSQFIDRKLDDEMSRITKYMDKPQSRPQPGVLFPGDSLADSLAVPDSAAAIQFNEPDPQMIYRDAYMDITRGNYQFAQQGFQEFLRRFPESNLADNAQYWLAETYYAQGELQRAVQEFQRVITDYPDGDKGAAAMLKIGFSYLKLDDRVNGKKFLNRVVQRFPYSEEARLAQERLSGLN